MEPQTSSHTQIRRATQLDGTLQQTYQQTLQLLATGELEDALEQSRLLLCAAPTSPLFWTTEGRIRAACDEWQAAKRSFARACDLAPDDPAALLERANFANVLGEHDQAAQWSQIALNHHTTPDERRDACLILAESNLALIQTHMANQLDEQIAQGESSPATTLPGTELVQQWMDQGLQAIQDALSTSRSHPELWDLKATYASLTGNTKEAVNAWKEAHRLAPQEARYLHDLAVGFEELRDHASAHEHYRKLHTLSLHQDADEANFLFEDYADLVAQAWQEVSQEMLPSLDITLPFLILAEDFPPQGMLDEAPRDAPFDPWIGMTMRATTQEDGTQAIRIALYQRNIERDAATDDPQELFLYIYDLLEDTLLYLDGLMNEDDIKA